MDDVNMHARPLLGFFLRLCAEIIEHERRAFSAARARRIERFVRRQRDTRRCFEALFGTEAKSTRRTVWIRERSGVWWEHANSNWTDSEWRDNFRMRKSTFQTLCDALRPHLQRQRTRLRRPLPVEQRVAICIWRLATNADFQTIGHLFGVGKSTAVIAANHVCDTIVKTMLSRFIRTPSGAEFAAIAQGFRDRWGFPQCVGAIDASHVAMLAPPNTPSEYYNRNGFYSIILQGVVDHRLKFWDINVGWPGKVHHARVFGSSSVFERGQRGTLLPDTTETFAGVQVPLVILGDSAYPLLPWLLKPYPDNRHTTPAQRTFNRRLGGARVTVARAFGRLKGRWRCLLKRYDGKLENVNNVVSACCVLHNFCEEHGERCADADVPEASERCDADDAAATASHDARDALCRYFSGL